MILKTADVEEHMIADWSYSLCRARDEAGEDISVVTWEGGPTMAWTVRDGLACPTGDDAPGDQTGAKLFRGDNHADHAKLYFDGMLAAIRATEN